MKIAVTSQNRKSVTDHAGRCRKFWIFEIEYNQIVGKTLLELPREQCFHESPPHQPHPLDTIDVLITRGICEGLTRRLAWNRVKSVVTDESIPENAVGQYLAGLLKEEYPPRQLIRPRSQPAT